MGWETCVAMRKIASIIDKENGALGLGVGGAHYEFIGNNWFCSAEMQEKV